MPRHISVYLDSQWALLSYWDACSSCGRES